MKFALWKKVSYYKTKILPKVCHFKQIVESNKHGILKTYIMKVIKTYIECKFKKSKFEGVINKQDQ